MGRRQVIDLSGMGHRAPISLGVRIDNVLYTSGISGRDTEKDEMPEDAAGQAKCMFHNIRLMMEAAGGSTDDIIYMQLRLKDRALREFVDPGVAGDVPRPGGPSRAERGSDGTGGRHAHAVPDHGGDAAVGSTGEPPTPPRAANPHPCPLLPSGEG